LFCGSRLFLLIIVILGGERDQDQRFLHDSLFLSHHIVPRPNTKVTMVT
jgi:hypothetical protein